MILDEIVKNKLQELSQINKNIRNFQAALKKDGFSLIAEIKRASPSNGDINLNVDIKKQARIYEQVGANAISVLTDKKYFKGDLNFLQQVKQATAIPILRKDFIIDQQQIYESKIFGADAVLLIASILNEKTLIEFVDLVHQLHMQCLVEAHTEEDIQKILKTKAKIIGINARNLKTMKIDLNTVVRLAGLIPKDKILIAESGIKTAQDVTKLKRAGVKGILVGTSLMESNNIADKIKELKYAS